MTENTRRCGNCHFFTNGACSAPMPLSFVGLHWRRPVKAESGAECGAHRMKAVRKPKGNGA